jgi:hypothetical protein
MTQILWFDPYKSLSSDLHNRCIDDKIGITQCHTISDFVHRARQWKFANWEGMNRTYAGDPCSQYCAINQLPVADWFGLKSCFEAEYPGLIVLPVMTFHTDATEAFHYDKIVPSSLVSPIIRSFINSHEQNSAVHYYGMNLDQITLPPRH